jgi:hypothetical protein
MFGLPTKSGMFKYNENILNNFDRSKYAQISLIIERLSIPEVYFDSLFNFSRKIKSFE